MEKLPKIKILYEDNHLLVVVKPINIPVQKDSSNDIDLLTMLKDYLRQKYNKQGNVYLGLVQRLDRPVGGVMVFAKTSKAASRLSEQIRKCEIKKEYLAVVLGNLKIEDTLIDYLIKNNKTNITTVTTDEKKGKKAILSYSLIEKKDNLNLVKINLVTGRSHQIRVQFSSRGNPLYGDMKYNIKAKAGENVALWCKKISFLHPTKKELVVFESDYPSFYPFNIFYKKNS